MILSLGCTVSLCAFMSLIIGLRLSFRRLPSTDGLEKKNVGILLLAPTLQGLRITFHCKIEQRESPRQDMLNENQYIPTQASTAAFSLTMKFKVCEVLKRQRKTSVNVFL